MAKTQEEQQPDAVETTADASDDARQMLLEGQEFNAPEAEEQQQEAAEPVSEAVPEAAPEADTQVPVPDATPETDPDPVETADPAPALHDQLQRLGFKDLPEDPSEAVDRLVRAYEDQQKQALQYEQLAQYGQKYLQEQLGREELDPQKADEQPIQEDAEREEQWWDPPKFEQGWLERYREVRIDPQSNQPVVDWKDNTPNEVKKAFNERQQYMEEWADALVQRPDEVLPNIIRQEVSRMLSDEFTQRDEAARHDSIAAQIEHDNADWMYEADPKTGERRYSEDGQQMVDILSEVTSRYPQIEDPAERWEMAVMRFDNLRFAQMQQQQAPPAAAAPPPPSGNGNTSPDKRKEHLRKGANQGLQNRRGSVAPAETPSDEPQNPHLSRGEALLQQLRQDGHEV